MRKMTMVSILALLAPSTAAAQGLEIVPQLGVTIGEYSGDNVQSNSSVGYMIGGKVRIGDPFYVDGGIFWAGSGGEVESTGETGDINYEALRFPVTVGLRILPLQVVTVRVFAGAVLNNVTKVDDNDFGVTDEDLKSTIWSGRVGAGADLLMFAVDLAYEFGLSNVFEDSTGAGDVKQNQFVVEAGLRFGI